MSADRGWLELSTDNCSIGRTLRVVGSPWTLLILRDAFNGVRRFGELQEHLGIARQVLADRLDRLVEEGLLARVAYREPGQRTRYEYRLTDRARDLYPVLVALMRWGDRYLADEEGPSVRLEHRGCGAPVEVALTCAQGHAVGSLREVVARPGPGARPSRPRPT